MRTPPAVDTVGGVFVYCRRDTAPAVSADTP